MVKEKIEQVLKRREKNKEQLEEKIKKLNEIKNSLDTFNDSKINEIINTLNKNLMDLYNKSKRNSLNILVTGVARQGKSTFLQTITGLTDKHIPTSDGKDLTATKSIIKNNLENKAIVKYLTEEEFIEMINAYYKELGLEKVNNINEFNDDIRLDKLNLTGTKGEYLNHLKFLRNKLNEFRYKLGSGEDEIRINEIRNYVAYENEKGERNLYLFAAVKEVVIYTEFQNKEVGKIAFIDLPGINDVKIGLLKRVAKEVKENVDAVFIMKKPSGEGDKFDNNDHQLYDILIDNLEEKAKDITYVIINKTPNNEKQCNILYEDVKYGNSSLKVKDAFVVNVKNKKEVDRLMIEVLEDIVRYIEESDRKELEEINKNFKELKDVIADLENELIDIAINSKLINKFTSKLEEEFTTIIRSVKNEKTFKEVYKNTIINSIQIKREEEYLNNKVEELKNILKSIYPDNIPRKTETFTRELANDILINIDQSINENLNKEAQNVKLKVSQALVKAGFNADEKEALQKFIDSLNHPIVKQTKEIFKELNDFEFDFKMIVEAEIVKSFNQFLKNFKKLLKDIIDDDFEKYSEEEFERIAIQIVKYDLDDTLIQLRDNLIRKYSELADEIIEAIMFKTLKVYNINENIQSSLKEFIRHNFHLLKEQNEISKNIKNQKKLEKAKQLIEGVINA